MPEDQRSQTPPEPPEEDPRQRLRRLLEEGENWESGAADRATVPLETPSDPDPNDQDETQHLGISWRDEEPEDTSPIPIGEGITPTNQRAVEPPPPAPEEADDLFWEEEAPTRKSTPRMPPPPPGLGDTPPRPLPSVDTRGMPLPRRVDQVDRGATRVTPAAYRPPARIAPPAQRPAPPPARPPEPRRGAGLAMPTPDLRRAWGCFLRLSLSAGFVLILAFLLFAAYAVFQYYRIEATLPEVSDLRNRASQFETSTILDRNGNVLYEIIDPNAGRRTYVSLDEISPFLIAATLATEDKTYYSHPGFDAWAILRAFYQNWQSGETVSGASTITQQLARLLFFDEEERYERTYMRKVREALLAIAITDNYSKDEILELYLNEINYGNLSYGIEAASQTYFQVPASQLDLGQAAFLAGLPQAPAVYDVYTNPDAVVGRLQTVLVLMVAASEEEGCIFVGVTRQCIEVEPQEAAQAFNAIIGHPFSPPVTQFRYPHWVTFIRSELEKLVDPQTIYRTGFIVRTTLDPVLQDKAQEIVAEQVASLADRNAGNGALIAIDPVTGEILAMVGSVDFYNETIDGQVNMALAPRQPGSAIKPLTYLAAFEKGWTPATLIWDVPSEFPPSGIDTDPSPPYKPVNYDERFHGPVTLRSALANSFNVPAVKALDFVGIYDDPATAELDGLVGTAQRLGITTLTRPDYGMALTLGGGEVPLVELAGAYQVFANGGRRLPPVGILRIEDRAGNVVFEYNPPAGDQVIRPEHAYLMSSILSDNAARTPMFGPNSVLNLPFPAASKTGTTNDFRDNWTMGYSNDIVVGVWVGNADNTPMVNTSGLSGAAPIYAEFMMFAAERRSGGNPGPFPRPANIVERVICSISGAEPSRFCPNQRSEFFAGDQPPQPATDDLWKEVLLDTWTGLAASPFCSEFTEEELVINVTDPWAIRWIRQQDAGTNWAESVGFEEPFRFIPRRACEEGDPQPTVWFDSPFDTQEITVTEVPIIGRVDAPDGIEEFTVDWGRGEDPDDWNRIVRRVNPFPGPEELGVWELDEDFEPGIVTLRIFVTGEDGGYAVRTIQVRVNIPTPTPTETPTETPTGTPTMTPTPSPTPTITPSPTPSPPVTPTPTAGIPPTVTPSETPGP